MIQGIKDARYRITELSERDLRFELQDWSRQDLISWLCWNDPNGVYTDEDSLREFDNRMSKEEGIEIVVRQIVQGED
jgi:hypothetical protein